jgi:DNA-directed RNA polymerase alpha subunit
MIVIKPVRFKKIPTKSELNQMTCDQLYSLARNRNGLKDVLIEFLESKENKKYFVRDIELSERLKNILLRAEINSLDELTYFRRDDVMSFNGMGVKALGELEKLMTEFKIEFRKIRNT